MIYAGTRRDHRPVLPYARTPAPCVNRAASLGDGEQGGERPLTLAHSVMVSESMSQRALCLVEVRVGG